MMFPIRNFFVRKHERALLFRDGEFVRFLEPGKYKLFDFKLRYKVATYDLSNPRFEHPLADFLVETYPEDVERLFQVVVTGRDEVAVVHFNDRVAEILGPAERKLYFKGVVKVRVDRYDLRESYELDTALAKRLVSGPSAKPLPVAQEAVYAVIVPETYVGLLFVDGEFVRSLVPGLHAFFKFELDTDNLETHFLRTGVRYFDHAPGVALRQVHNSARDGGGCGDAD